MGIVSTPMPPVPKDPAQREAHFRALAKVGAPNYGAAINERTGLLGIGVVVTWLLALFG